jgi:hypothetical protein
MKIVFIHLGIAENDHLIGNMMRFLHLFPQHEVHLVTSAKTSIKDIPSSIHCHVYNPSEITEKQFQSLAHDEKFRQGFWRFSLERLLALSVVHSLYPAEPILHLESDVLLMPNFPFESIAAVDSLMWNLYNSDHDVSAILLSPNLKTTLKLEKMILEKIQVNPKLTDMTLLNEVWRDKELDVKHFAGFCSELPELKNESAKPFERSEEGVGFGGLFDGAAIGMWLLGHDPKNNYGKSIIHNESVILSGNSYIDPSAVDYELSEKGELYLVSRVEPVIRMPIWNLHAHCKNVRLLGIGWEAELRKYIELSKDKDQIVIMEWSIVWKMFVMSLKTRTFLGFLLGIPLLQPTRRKLSPLKRFIRKPSRVAFVNRAKR